METNELFKLRIEDYGRERESLRSLEWKTFFQVYVGFGTLAVALPKLHQTVNFPKTVFAAGFIAILALWLAATYLLSGIHIRMKHASDLKRAYFRRLHVSLQAEAEPEPGNLSKYWAALPQHALLFVTMVGFAAWWLITCFS